VRKVKLLDRTKLVELIGRHVTVGAFKDQLEVNATVIGLAERMRAQKGK
jgi:phage terminase small subunit